MTRFVHQEGFPTDKPANMQPSVLIMEKVVQEAWDIPPVQTLTTSFTHYSLIKMI